MEISQRKIQAQTKLNNQDENYSIKAIKSRYRKLQILVTLRLIIFIYVSSTRKNSFNLIDISQVRLSAAREKLLMKYLIRFSKILFRMIFIRIYTI